MTEICEAYTRRGMDASTPLGVVQIVQFCSPEPVLAAENPCYY
mgnify:CR=1 FL=1